MSAEGEAGVLQQARQAAEAQQFELALTLLNALQDPQPPADAAAGFELRARAHRGLQDLASAEAVAAQGVQLYPKSRALQNEYVAVALARKDWGEAAKRLERLRVMQGSSVTGWTYARLIQAYRSCGRLEAAEAVLRVALLAHPKRIDLQREQRLLQAAVRSAPDVSDPLQGERAPNDPQGWLKAAKRRLSQHELRSAQAALEEAVRLFPLDLGLNDLLVDTLIERQSYAAAADRADQLLQNEGLSNPWKLKLATKRLRAQQLAGRAEAFPPFLGFVQQTFGEGRIAAVKPVVSVCGFYYSGSSAIFQFLQQAPNAVAWAPNGMEFRILAEQGGFLQLCDDATKQGGIRREALLELALHMFGQRPKSLPQKFPGSPSNTNDEFRKIAQSEWLGAWAQACQHCLRVLLAEAERPADQAPREHWRQKVAESVSILFRSLRYVINPDADCLILDQAPHVAHFRGAEILPPGRIIIVSRDPRDQFVDGNAARSRERRPLRSVDWFIDRYRRLERLVRQEIPKLEQMGHRVLRVRFEDFVRSELVQRQVAEFSGLAFDRMALKSRFDGSVSVKNIGLFRRGSAQEVRRIEQELSDYLVD